MPQGRVAFATEENRDAGSQGTPAPVGPRVLRVGTANSRRFAIAAAAMAGFWLLHAGWMLTTLGGTTATAWSDGLAELLAALVAAGCCAAAALHGARASRRGWALMAASALSWTAGQAAWCWFGLLQGRETPFPSAPDGGFLLAVPLAVAAVLAFPGAASITSRLRCAIDGLIVAIALLSVSWASVLGAAYRAGGDGPLAAGLLLAHPAGDVAVGTMLVVLAIRAPRHGRLPLLMLAGGLAAMALADSTFAYGTVSGAFHHAGLAGSGWVAGSLLIGLAALRSPDRPVGAAMDSPFPPVVRRLLPYLPVAAATVMVVDVEVHGGSPDRFLFATMVLLIALVVARQALTLGENADLIRRLRSREHQLERHVRHDPLTGLANRARFRELVGEAIAGRRAEGGPAAAVLFIHLDGFRIVDETLGHEAGEQLLVAFVRRLLACVRPTDTVARIGDHEFGVLIPRVGGSDRLVELAERILDELDEPSVTDEGAGTASTVSVGMAIADGPDLAADELLRRAHVAMHAARVGEEELVGFFEPGHHAVLERHRHRGGGAPHRRQDTTPGLDGENGVRLWMARELHDDALQTLTTMLIDMEQLRRDLPEEAVSSRVLAYQASVRSAISGLRRLVGDLRRQPGEDHRLVEDLGALLGQLDDRAGVKGQLSVSPSWPSSLSSHISSHLRRIAEEALRNVASHSGAQRVVVRLDAEEDQLTLTVSDDGQGCESLAKGSGLLGMRERALILGGQLEVTSRPGAGTTVRGTFASRSA